MKACSPTSPAYWNYCCQLAKKFHISPFVVQWLWQSFKSQQEVHEALLRHIRGEPLAYILGQWDFYGRPFYVNPHVLIPRKETEVLVKETLFFCHPSKPQHLIELGTGSGCIAITLAKEANNLRITAVDISASALAVAKTNAKQYALFPPLLTWQLADACTLDTQNKEKADILVANPPYISPDDPDLSPSVRNYEPELAWKSTPTGLEYYESWGHTALSLLKPNGVALFEIGHRQAQKVCAILQKMGFTKIAIKKDWSQHDRIFIGRT